MLSNSGMILPLQGQGHRMRVTEIEKIAYFGEITGPRSINSAQFRLADSRRHFSKANIQYFVLKIWWTSQIGSIMGKIRCHGNQVSNVGKCTWWHKLSYLSNRWRYLDNLSMHVYGVNYVAYYPMVVWPWLVKVKVIAYGSLELKKWHISVK